MKKVRDLHPTQIRLPDDLREWLKILAKKEMRSMGTQVVYILEQFKNDQENHA